MNNLLLRTVFLFIIYCACTLVVHAQGELCIETQFTTSHGDHTPLWLNANKHGLSSLDPTNGYVRTSYIRSTGADSLRKWKRGYTADVALAGGFTSTFVIQQLYGEVGWRKGLLTLGAKEQTLELKNQELSSGAQTLGINSRPVPGLRFSLPDYWDVPGLRGWVAVKGHIFYGWTTDDKWQKDFTQRKSKYTENTMLHTKAGFVRFGKTDKPFTVEAGIEMGCQFAGTSYQLPYFDIPYIKNESGLPAMWHALIPGGSDAVETDFRNKEGNHVGSWLVRANYETSNWVLSANADHFFEDQSQMFFLDYDGYGTGEEWDKWKRFNWLVYDLHDIQLGVELRLKHFHWIEDVVAEYLYTKYQSGAIYHDHTYTISDHVGGQDHYYNHSIFTGWQHWGQVIGNPLYMSPLYNSDGDISVRDNRFIAYHLGISGTPTPCLHYRLLATWQKGFGNYNNPYINPRKNTSLLAETTYLPPDHSWLRHCYLKGAFAFDRGSLLGNNTGVQLTIGYRPNI